MLDPKRTCQLVKLRSSDVKFPVHGTTKRVSVTDNAVRDWLSHVLTGDANFFVGRGLQPERSGLPRADNEPWAVVIANTCKSRAESASPGGSLFDAVSLSGTKEKRIVERFQRAVGGTDFVKAFFATLSLHRALKDLAGFGRGSEAEFVLRLLMGRALACFKFAENVTASELLVKLTAKQSTNHNDVDLNQKSLERFVCVYKKVKDNRNLRFAWGYFDKLSKNGGLFKQEKKRLCLDFGGVAPLETLQTARGEFDAVPCSFLLSE